MTGPTPEYLDIIRRIVRAYLKHQLVRFKIAKAVMGRVASLAHDKIVAEVQGYQSYIWVPQGRGREYRVWAPSLTAPPEGWLRDTGIVTAPPMAVDWHDVYRSLLPVFTYQSIIVESVRNMLGILTDIRLEEDYLALEKYDGSANYGDYNAWYYVTSDGIKIDYAAPTPDGPQIVRVSYTTTTCPVRNRLKNMLDRVSRGIMVYCEGRSFLVQYSAVDCPALDQLVTLLRQILDQQIHCPTDFPARIAFLTGPLRGFVGLVSPDQFITWDGSRVSVYELSAIEESFNRAVETCAEVMTREVCARYGPPPRQECPPGMYCVEVEECEQNMGGTCELRCGQPGENRCCCRV
jgi:hypothetical protein